jgi:hypothetical protein
MSPLIGCERSERRMMGGGRGWPEGLGAYYEVSLRVVPQQASTAAKEKSYSQCRCGRNRVKGIQNELIHFELIG